VRVSLGLSFYDEPSLVEAVGSLRFEVAEPLKPGSISLDESLHTGAHDPNASLEMIEERRDDDIGGGDDIQIVDEPIKSTDSPLATRSCINTHS
jgi:hypothetical protein